MDDYAIEWEGLALTVVYQDYLGGYLTGYGYVLIFFLAGAALVLLAIGMSRTLTSLGARSKARANGGQALHREKGRAYESGELPVGIAWIQFPVHFFIFALLFVVFDVEAIFIITWAVLFRSLGVIGFIEVMIFVGVLVCGLAYAWKKGVLRWV